MKLFGSSSNPSKKPRPFHPCYGHGHGLIEPPPTAGHRHAQLLSCSSHARGQKFIEERNPKRLAQLFARNRIVVLGDDQVGKSSLIRRYALNQYDPLIESTKVPPEALHLPLQLILDTQYDSEMEILDVPAATLDEQPEYETRARLARGDGFLLVLSLSDPDTSLTRAKRAYNLIQRARQYHPSIPLILVGNKCDLAAEQISLPSTIPTEFIDNDEKEEEEESNVFIPELGFEWNEAEYGPLPARYRKSSTATTTTTPMASTPLPSSNASDSEAEAPPTGSKSESEEPGAAAEAATPIGPSQRRSQRRSCAKSLFRDADSLEGRVLALRRVQEFADGLDVPYYEVSAKTGRNVNKVFHELLELIHRDKRAHADMYLTRLQMEKGSLSGSLASIRKTNPKSSRCSLM